MLEPERERTLIAQAKDGDRATRECAFQEIFSAMRGPLFALCHNLAGDATEAEDVLQEVFLAAHCALPRFRGESRLSTWLHRIAIRIALRSKAQRRKRAALPLESEPTARSMEDPVVTAELTAEFGKALAALSFRERVVLSLFSVEDLSHGEIAEILGIPVGTVWSRLHNARKRLLLALETHLENRPGAITWRRDRTGSHSPTSQ
jgi:RNA polymerase sigma-70 factor (ECF subfamily)